MDQKEIEKESSDSSESSSVEDYNDLKDEIKNKGSTKNKNVGKLLKDIVRKSTKNSNVILSKLKTPFDKLKAEKEERKKLFMKKTQKLIQKKLGFRRYSDYDIKNEKKLRKIATKGIVKLFGSILDYKKKINEEKEEEERKIEKKSSNFLMMHNLDPNFKLKTNKNYKEESEENSQREDKENFKKKINKSKNYMEDEE